MMSITERIGRIFLEALSIEVPSATTDIIAAGLLDSLALVTLLFEIEQEFDIRIPLDGLDIAGLSTLERIAALVEGLILARDSPPLTKGGVRQ
jgi:D-alanine--poly(phosphoribitol) ligase subunit 2